MDQWAHMNINPCPVSYKHLPVKSWENMNFYLMEKENKMLITFDKKAYIVDISDLGNMK